MTHTTTLNRKSQEAEVHGKTYIPNRDDIDGIYFLVGDHSSKYRTGGKFRGLKFSCIDADGLFINFRGIFH